MARQAKQYDDDDGRVICNMDVEGTPWHDRRVAREQKVASRPNYAPAITRSESRRYTWYSLLAGLTVASVFSITWVLFILFCTQIWFR